MNEERQENLEEIRKAVEKQLKKDKKVDPEKANKLMEEALENVDFLKTLKEINVSSQSKRVIFVDGKACLVYDSGIFYIEDSMDSKKGKKKLTKQQATELYVEYFFRYIMNPAIEQKKLMEQVRKIAVKTKTAPKKAEKTVTKNKVKEKAVEKKEEVKAKVKAKEEKAKEEYVR